MKQLTPREKCTSLMDSSPTDKPFKPTPRPSKGRGFLVFARWNWLTREAHFAILRTLLCKAAKGTTGKNVLPKHSLRQSGKNCRGKKCPPRNETLLVPFSLSHPGVKTFKFIDLPAEGTKESTNTVVFRKQRSGVGTKAESVGTREPMLECSNKAPNCNSASEIGRHQKTRVYARTPAHLHAPA